MGKNAFLSERMDEQHPNWEQAIQRQGKLYSRPGDFRSDFGRDYTRIIHSTAFRRLKHKTQVFFTTQNDHICTRIEHVNHVDSVSYTIGTYLGLNTELIRAIANGHDLGHAPFGHLGERLLGEISQKELGTPFWHEKHGLRVVDDIETLLGPDGKTTNMMLTYAVRDGIISHCGEVKAEVVRPRQAAVVLESIEKPNEYEPYTWEGCVVKVSDKIAYLGRDIEDALRLHILQADGQPLKDLLKQVNLILKTPLQSVTNTAIMYQLIGDICEESDVHKGIVLSSAYIHLMDVIMEFNLEHIYRNSRLEVYHQYAHLIIQSIYHILQQCYDGAHTMQYVVALRQDYPMLGKYFGDWMEKYSDIGRAYIGGAASRAAYDNRVIYKIEECDRAYKQACIDFIAGMTDTFAEKIFTELITLF